MECIYHAASSPLPPLLPPSACIVNIVLSVARIPSEELEESPLFTGGLEYISESHGAQCCAGLGPSLLGQAATWPFSIWTRLHWTSQEGNQGNIQWMEEILDPFFTCWACILSSMSKVLKVLKVLNEALQRKATLNHCPVTHDILELTHTSAQSLH